MKILKLAPLLLTSCLTGRTIDIDTKEPVVADTKVTRNHWICCRNICRKPPKSVTKEAYTSYVICECRDKRIFRIAKISK